MSVFLPVDAEAAVNTLLEAKLPDVAVGSIGDQDFDDNDQLVFNPPCARTRYAGTQWMDLNDNQRLAYNCDHLIEVWCVAENLTSREDQREDTKTLLGKVAVELVGSRLPIGDGKKSEPVRAVDVKTLQGDVTGTIYVLSVIVPGIAQFPGTNA